MASSKPKTTMNKLNRERKVRERRLDKQARKNARDATQLDHLGNPVDVQLVDHLGNPLDHLGNRIPIEDLPPALTEDGEGDEEEAAGDPDPSGV
jgi:hypothetical protein